MPGFRFLVKTNADLGYALSSSQAAVGPLQLRFSPLLPMSSRVLGFGARTAEDWFVAQFGSELDPGTAWDACHQHVASGQGLSATSGVTYAEPDWPQSWIPSEYAEVETVSPFGVTVSCGAEQRWMSNADAPHGSKPDWHLDDEFSGLRRARNSVTDALPRTVRIGHLDTGYDPLHQLLPGNLRTELGRSFVDGEQPNSAADPYVTGELKAPGHGTGTVCILAGTKLENLQFNDENTGDYLGGAPNADVIPVRIAPSVVLFYTSAFAKGLDYLTAPNGDTNLCADVVTMSMGGLASAAWTEIVNRAYELGIPVFAAAGNNFGGLPTHNIVYPARYNRVTAVCGVMSNGSPYYNLGLGVMAGNYGPDSKMDTAIATYTPNIPWALWGCEHAYRWNGQGTSAATPQAAATAALYIQKNLAAINAYSQAWMKVEAVRKAIFDSARKNTISEWKTYYGNGTVNAAAAMDVQPAREIDLRKQPVDTASFPFLKVLTGLGVSTAASADAMLELEIVQLTQRSKTLESIIPDPHLPAEQIDGRLQTQFFEAILADLNASKTLKGAISSHFAGSKVNVPDVPPTPATEALGAALTTVHTAPPCRSLRGYAFDPGLSTELQNVDISTTTYSVIWEPDLRPGPVGEYLEVVDYDYSAASGYAPVDLNDKSILAQNGLAPSEGNAQFHQQMVYAVAMSTIRHFELALGRKAMWADDKGAFVQRLRLLPHAMNDQNAFYSPERKSVLFGYFDSPSPDPTKQYPGGVVYTCLSHDIIAHEVTHALLDGMHRGFREPSNPDVLAFHEAFADIVALFHQFSNPAVVRSQLAAVRGDLSIESLLGNLARQFGEATSGHAALRSAYLKLVVGPGTQPLAPDPLALQNATEPHARGAVLLAAVYGAFLSIYRNRTADLLRIATSGTGVLPLGAMHPDLVNRLCLEAGKSARHALRMCIRALDYCPPVDITFGEFLRAIITADYDVVEDDELHYRISFVESFRRWGIYPPDLPTLSIETLLWNSPQIDSQSDLKCVFDLAQQNLWVDSGSGSRPNV